MVGWDEFLQTYRFQTNLLCLCRIDWEVLKVVFLEQLA
ncbi:hypothetical protein LEP1GSC108_3237 [Leptospira weilii str. UI 13098]|uniref:Uncharacterized protein n=1 Tax=Leptospira weilii str. UI 13098 TaxID=1088542 RepID=M6QFE1_9LEPT|nr:hypothetical protein LEP1GSC108_3237 [Leptospira weilii str. UI 13098]